MPFRLVPRAGPAAIPIEPVAEGEFDRWLKAQPGSVRAWMRSTGVKGKAGEVSLLPGETGKLARVVLGVDPKEGLWNYGDLASRLPAGRYRLDKDLERSEATRAALGWAIGTYRFTRYRKEKKAEAEAAVLEWPRNADRRAAERTAAAVFLVRDLTNTPSSDMGPAELAAAARSLARASGARVRVITGAELERRNYPAVFAVGKASARAPRLVDLAWGNARAPKVTIVGKGICFDSGGLDLKPAAAMKLMKKDMAGAAHALALARMIMDAGLPVRLRVLLPIADNAVSGNALRPLDVIRTRKGITVEIGNTDAEGRLVLCDALFEAARERPALLVDFATLTGAARVALGIEVPALFANDEDLAEAILRAGREENDPLWRLPLWTAYRKNLDSEVADINNVADGPYGGAITAALFLAEFVGEGVPWAHVDFMAWNEKARAGRPVGAEAMGLRAVYRVIAERFGGRRETRRKTRP